MEPMKAPNCVQVETPSSYSVFGTPFSAGSLFRKAMAPESFSTKHPEISTYIAPSAHIRPCHRRDRNLPSQSPKSFSGRPRSAVPSDDYARSIRGKTSNQKASK